MAITERYVTYNGTDTYANCTDPAKPCSWATMLANAAAGDRFNIQWDGTHSYSISGDSTFSHSGTATSPIVIRGYRNTITDGYQGRANGNGALVGTNMPTIACSGYKIYPLNWTVLETLNITGSTNAFIVQPGAYGGCRSCIITNSNTGDSIGTLAAGQLSLTFGCDLTLSGASGGATGAVLTMTSGAAVARANRITAGATSAIGVKVDSGTGGGITVVDKNLIYAGSGHHISTVSHLYTSLYAVDNTLLDANGGSTIDGINIVTGEIYPQWLIGNQITDETEYAINGVSAANAVVGAYNRTTRNTSGPTNSATDWLAATSGWGNVTGAQAGADAAAQRLNEYYAPNSNDYRLKLAALGRGAGLPAYMDIGALQRMEDYPAIDKVLSPAAGGPATYADGDMVGTAPAASGGAPVFGGHVTRRA